MKTLIIDNYDSYTYNLFQMVAEINDEEPTVIFNNSDDWARIKREIPFDNIIISPGPGSADVPSDFGICSLALMEDDIPILGVCLGHQGLGYVNGAAIIRSPDIAHGKISRVYHSGDELFAGIPDSFSVVRYHSLLLADRLPSGLVQTAWTADGFNMGIRCKNKPHWGVQFHPESIASEYGEAILKNFSRLSIKQKSMFGSVSHNSDIRKLKEKAQPVASAETESQSKYTVFVRKLSKYEDPERVFRYFYMNSSRFFWLDSNRKDGNMSRFSFMGDTKGPLSLTVTYYANLKCVIEETNIQRKQIETDIFDYLDDKLRKYACKSPELPFDFNAGFVGFYGYETKGRLTAEPVAVKDEPDSMFMFADRLIAFDTLEQDLYMLCLTDCEEEAEAWFEKMEKQFSILNDSLVAPPVCIDQNVDFHLHQSYEEYLSKIQEVKRNLVEGESYEINLTNEICAELEVNPVALYLNVRQINPAPYSAFIRFDDLHIMCSSPERFIKIDRERNLEAKPIKGTISRGKTPSEDERLKEKLRTSAKDFSENLMIVDLLRNDLGMVCEVGSVHVPKLMEVETFETVHQLVSTVRGKLKASTSLNSCIKAIFPGGSMTGAPKKRSMEIIEQLEARRRGIYSGAIGFLGLNETVDLNIVIRTIVQKGNRLSVGVGGAIVIDSDPDQEFDEILLKANALLRAIAYTVKGSGSNCDYLIHGQRDNVCISSGGKDSTWVAK